MSQAMTVTLEHFEGPLDLLLHLIKQYELDIYDIPIAEVTHQYVRYIKNMKDQQLHVAGEFLVMASTLMAIKSEWMLPRTEREDLEEDDYDPRQELTDRLVEYQLYKSLSHQLKDKLDERQQFYTKEASDLSSLQEVVLLDSDSIEVEKLHDSLLRVYKRYKMMNPPESMMDVEEISLEDKMNEIESILETSKDRQVYFSSCLKSLDPSHLVISFLSVLELVKQGVLRAFQQEQDGDILLTYLN